VTRTLKEGAMPGLRSLLTVSLVVLCAGGCAVSAREREALVPPAVLSAYLADKPEPLHPHYSMVLVQGPRNALLNEMRSGLAAYELGGHDAATRSFDRVLQGIEAVYADNEDAKKARELFTRESYKDFKGEPYERAMAYYYRGLLYMHEGDYQNARASFKGGILQDAFAEEEQNRADFALLIFLEGWASRCAGDPGLARDSFEEVAKLKSDFAAPAADANALVIVETGPAPVKFADGPKRQMLRYRRGDGVEEMRANVLLAGDSRPAFPIEDVYFQASSRGGRPVEYILEGKAKFKEGTETAATVGKTIGTAALLAGLASGNRNVALAGAGVMALGFLADGIASAMKPEADARYWDNLPDKVHVLPLALTEQPHDVRAEILDGGGELIAGLVKSGQVKFSGKCGLAWIRSRPATPGDVRAPGTVTR
jgi:tetratricopeptide (TPR) repeat protein